MGRAKPKLLLLPGLDGTGDLFVDLLPCLAAFEVTVVRYPRDRVQQPTELLNLIRAHLPSTEFFLAAESFSTPLAMQIAAEQPPGLRALMLSAAFASNPANVFEHALLALIAPIAVWLPLSSLVARVYLVGWRAPKRLLRLVQTAVDSVKGQVLLARLRQSVAVDVRPELAKVQVPMLSLRATRDRMIPARCNEEIARLGARVSVVEFDAPHTLLQDKPRECAAAMTEFASDVMEAG